MLFAIISTDIKNSLPKRKISRPAHIERLKQLEIEGRLFVAGPHPAVESDTSGNAGFTGSLVIAEFSSQSDAEVWAQADPYITAGVYANVVVKPFIKALPLT
jgi:uncharacterized protein